MSETTTATAEATGFNKAATSGAADTPYYVNNPGQRAPWYKRLKQRGMTARKIALYMTVAVIIALSSPILPTFIMGATMIAVGVALRIWTFGHLEKNEHMITSGPYAHSRNPAYLGSFIITSGFVLAAGNPFTPAGLLVWGLGLAMLVLFFMRYLPRKYAREYPRLEQAFPEQFSAHAANVPDFFPRLSPWRSGDNRRFSWQCVQANHEFLWPTLLSLGLILLWLV